MTLRAQIAAALGLLTIVAAAGAAVFAFTTIDQRLHDETDDFLDDRIAQVHAYIEAVEDGRLTPVQVPVPATQVTQADPDGLSGVARYDAEMRFYLADGSLRFALSDVPLPVTRDDIDRTLRTGEVLASRVTVEDRTYETRLVPIEPREGVQVVLQIGRDITTQLDALDRLRFRLAVVVALVAAAACAAGYFLAARLSSPLEKLRVATREIADTKDFSQTVGVEGRGEIADVATDFNLMLSELESSAIQQRRLVQDAGHELRTPLSTLRASVELARRVGASSDPQADEQDELLRTAIGEVDELSRLVDELVNLAGIPFDDNPNEILDLDQVVTDAVEAFRRKHPQRNVEVEVGPSEPIEGKEAHLGRAIANVLANADKFASDDTRIDVSVRGNQITIADRGPGIPPEDLDRIFDKFYRSSTVQTIDGSGLGLAFVAEVVGAHHGTVSASNRSGGGAVITLAFPPAD